MKLLDAKVEWYPEFDNDPELQILVNFIPDSRQIIHNVLEISPGLYLYYGQKYEYVSYLLADESNKRGFGGKEFVVKTGDGDKYIPGPWSSRAGVVNKLTNVQCVDVHITNEPKAFARGYTFSTGAVTVEFAREAANKAGVSLERTTYNGEPLFIPHKVIPQGTIGLNRLDTLLLDTYRYLLGNDNNKAETLKYRLKKHFIKYYGREWHVYDIHGDYYLFHEDVGLTVVRKEEVSNLG